MGPGSTSILCDLSCTYALLIALRVSTIAFHDRYDSSVSIKTIRHAICLKTGGISINHQ